MARNKQTIPEMAASMAGTAVAEPLPPSFEDWQAEVDAELGPATSDGPAGPAASEAVERIDTGPNPDLTPPPVNPDPWWEVTCPEFGLPRRDIQAANEQVAALLYNQSFNLRRPKPTVKRIETEQPV